MPTMTEAFITNFLNHDDVTDGTVSEISKHEFEERTKRITQERFFELRTYIEPTPHPLQRVFKEEDYYETYDNGSFMEIFIFLFKYKGKYYDFYQYCEG